MAKKKTRSAARKRRHKRVRRRISGTRERPRLNIFRSSNNIFVQIIDDETGTTLISASSIESNLKSEMDGLKKSEQARIIGMKIAERAIDQGIKNVVFDRGGYRYSGRVKALADGAREAGLQF
ncbi:MAG: 50S ribosomal protein L18 [Anaerolineales bacterium]|jgi:large subunit ribosomal protein L18